ncbi:3-phosphoshikimate 1-carboxyvinyltransferase 1 [Apilactobacillus kunkeei]|uniref:3-phosphoshikimate 1-carboxyvinyltransferase n=1 Tax=Apilactobacillus waqarii TaxID=2851006 RepID=UPI0022068908|nr:3-phosphoshikimate 1-carboxyvinyltransferase 1 [Apilactobacillus kunkeei]CAI2556660.1 3-phosphoshikimate 1-carboxyvinyltransferase 1 [Apilactobacillus kunkeei]CAI2557177.1 3-phosphoshikimate 1-carboxyvinyltransferase 1 [Apilactobacillus kunkeei]CAI2557183.1 3-phosphoshikimate 1-carboxyvinyltransferase 1 [Apilactobacillus kunkeei]CAI2557278.1 3-phosphoshikimate 1-carboxyvinyltransferase 1 [Apilactobacillus kunkeei]
MKELVVNMNTGLHGDLAVPGDKSISHRSVILSSISEGTSHIHHFLASDDCISTINAFRAMGVEIDLDGDELTVEGVGLNGLSKPETKLDMGNSGTTTRLLSGLLAAQEFTTNLIGDDSLSKRPMQRVSEPLSMMGANIETTDGHLPMTINPGHIKAVKYELPMASAQVKSAIILAALNADEDSVIVEPQVTRDHTETMLNQFGEDVIERNGNEITVHHQPKLTAQDFNVPGDISSAAFFLVAATLVPNSHIVLKNVGINPTRTGILDVLIKMGANIRLLNQTNDSEPTADIEVTYTPNLKPIDVTEESIPLMIDELPLVALLASRADGHSTITGAEELRFKETDRIKTVVMELQKLGIQITELPDGFSIDGSKNWQVVDSSLDSHGDHRIGMTLAVAALLLDTDVRLNGEDAISISYPQFFDHLKHLSD